MAHRSAALGAARDEAQQRTVYLGSRLNAVQSLAIHARRSALGCMPGTTQPTRPIELKPVATGLSMPVYVTHANDGSGRLFVVEKAGTIRVVRNGSILETPYLDLRSQVLSEASQPPGHQEQGLLSVAFHPDFARNGRLFVNYTSQPGGKTIVAEYKADPAADVADATSARTLLEQGRPEPFHNGGLMKFGPDGFLYIGMGDGGRFQAGQDLSTLLGKLLRIDVDAGQPYAIPRDNPFVGQAGAKGEVYALGMRNPWRFSFDRCDASLFLGDVGARSWEEVSLIVPGGNYGWARMEGMHCNPKPLCDMSGLVKPIAEYGHLDLDEQGGQSVTGGHVYRGTQAPELRGHYLFADFFTTRIWTLYQSRDDAYTWKRVELLKAGFPVSSFGEGPDGELYVVDYSGGIHLLTQAAQ
ncbi:MAG: PQQ-dependent sugar dehydrogenase [Burkholderiales bacterium]|nr:PQQ-dependent sugar dehydrogenase [Burkholderiales bacterium]